MCIDMTDKNPPSPVEAMKKKSRGLRGTLAESLVNGLTGSLNPEDHQAVVRYHGIYQQDDRDRREERERKKLERAFNFMIRLRLPGGDLDATQWLGFSSFADKAGTGVIKITTRQTIQIHGIVKSDLKPTMAGIYALGVDTIATAGDINRTVVCSSDPATTKFHDEVHSFAASISAHLLPKTKAFTEVWLDGEKLSGDEPEEDPLYGKTYLPRKFKIAIAIPPRNDVDVFTNDIGLIAIEENGAFTGFNVAIGGGLGTTHGNSKTYPRLASVIGYVPKEKILDVTWQIVALQRDFGDRSDRSQARFKYTIDRMGLEAVRTELEKRLGFSLEAAKPFSFSSRGDTYGWRKDFTGKWFYTLFLETGRVVDTEGYKLKTALHEIAETGLCTFRLTTNQNVMLTGVADKDKSTLEMILARNGISAARFSAVRTEALACVALNSCPLALAEGQRYLPSLLTKIEELLAKYNLTEQPISIRMTGCPNGCARPNVAEIGLIGKSLGHYNLYLGGGRTGQRLNRIYKENLQEEEILAELDSLFALYARERQPGEFFGDYTQRTVTFGDAA
jgi:sulfite reductase (NADPH) hemoprotein beta-component